MSEMRWALSDAEKKCALALAAAEQVTSEAEAEESAAARWAQSDASRSRQGQRLRSRAQRGRQGDICGKEETRENRQGGRGETKARRKEKQCIIKLYHNLSFAPAQRRSHMVPHERREPVHECVRIVA